VLNPGSFNLTTGAAKAHATVRISQCSNSLANTYIQHFEGLRGLNFSPTSNGWYHVACDWSLSLKIVLETKPVSPANRSILSIAGFRVHCDLHDLTTGYGTSISTPGVGLSDSNGTLNFTLIHHPVLVTRSVKLIAGDKYEFLTYLSYTLQAYSYPWVPAGASASATLEMNSPARGATVVSLSVT
jgi:hypothetical protein